MWFFKGLGGVLSLSFLFSVSLVSFLSVSVFLSLKRTHTYAHTFTLSLCQASLSINVLEESLTGDAQKIKDAEDESTFGAEKLEELLLGALKSFEAAKMYEYMISVYKLLIPIYEASKNYDKLQRVYGNIDGRPLGY